MAVSALRDTPPGGARVVAIEVALVGVKRRRDATRPESKETPGEAPFLRPDGSGRSERFNPGSVVADPDGHCDTVPERFKLVKLD